MKKILQAMILAAGIVGWWGLVYPELCLSDKNVRIVELGDTDEEEICIKFRSAEYLSIIRRFLEEKN